MLCSIYPAYPFTRADQLKNSDNFVATLWDKRGKLREDHVRPLFRRYEEDKARDKEYLNRITSRLKSFGLECMTAGRNFVSVAEGADLIVIDLFLDSLQGEDAMQTSVNGLTQVISKRPDNPPLVILMSRSSRLEGKRVEFRDNVGLFESTFRIIRKKELDDEGKLSRLLTRLIEHYTDSRKLVAFVNAWRDGVTKACDRTAKLIRKLDLADIAQIRQLLLTGEGEHPGSYLVDVFDLVLQHEIERDSTIIDTALCLSEINSDIYPPRHIPSTPDLQSLVCRSLFENIGRLRLRTLNSTPVLFGDVLLRTHHNSPAISDCCGAAPSSESTLRINEKSRLSSFGPRDVLVVMTPACDLARESIKPILLLRGTLVALTPQTWSYRATPIRTSVFEESSGDRSQIEWDLKHVETFSPEELKGYLLASDGFQVVARLRESPALELQQKLLSNLGRVGIIAPMPATFSVRIGIFTLNHDMSFSELVIPDLSRMPGVCFVGRTKDGAQARKLVLSEDACEAIGEALQELNIDAVHPGTREIICKTRSGSDLLMFQRGIDFPPQDDKVFRKVSVSIQGEDEDRVIALIGWSGLFSTPLSKDFVKKGGFGFIMSITGFGK